MKVNILMSTYNGEKFVAEQIESIQKQTFQDWNLIIRDDGSTDKTCEIADRFISADSRIRLIRAENLGVIQSFFELVKMETADFYFFADQDDYWLPEKLEIMLNEAQKHDNNRPVMYYTDLKVVDKQLTVLSESMIKSQSGHANTQLVQELTENTVTGCTSMINHALATLWESTNNVIMHDWYLALLATAIGKLVYIAYPTVLYRQHENNVLGARTMDKRFKIIREGLKVFQRYWELIHKTQDQATEIVKNFGDQLGEKQEKLLVNFSTLNEKNFLQRVQSIYKYKYSKNKFLHIFVFRALLITNFRNPK